MQDALKSKQREKLDDTGCCGCFKRKKNKDYVLNESNSSNATPLQVSEYWKFEMISRVDVIQERWAQRLLTQIEKIDNNAAKIFQSELYLLS